ncbi:hypothetical protein GGI07_004052 [Coemansia sp. Benny D115]|nr:hypothetical protein GGI07_004052 [Coemansia sp. Benny D115]
MDQALPGQLVTYDFRQPSASSAAPASGIPRPLRVVQWNIERGYRLDEVIATLKRLDADILCLQEIDICNQRSGNTDHARILAEQLKLNVAVAIEFQELASPCRTPEQQGGGLHGNAILTKFDMHARVLDHSHQPYDWPHNGMLLGEPRLGRRCVAVAEVLVPARPPLLVYSAHFECFTGITGRLGQLCDLMLDSSRAASRLPHQLVFGDFNTFAHSIARLSPRYANGWYRFRSLGLSEPEWWLEHVLSWYADDGRVNARLADEGAEFSPDILRAAVNPGWWDPFDAVKDITISNHLGFMTAKADWAFVRQMRVIGHWMENRDFAASDHRCLVLEVEHAHSGVLDEHRACTKRTARELALRRRSKLWTCSALLTAVALSAAAVRLALPR